MPTRDTNFRLTDGEVLLSSPQNENWKDYETSMEHFHGNRIISGFAASDGGGLTIDVAAGEAFISGTNLTVGSTTTDAVTMPQSVTRWLWLKASRTYTDSGGVITDTVPTFELTAASGTPTGDGILLAEIVSGVATITSVTDKRDWANKWNDRDTFTFANDLASFDTTTRIFKARMEEVINVGFGGTGSEIADATQQWIYCPYAFTITGVTMGADQSGSIVIDIWNDTHANYPPTDADSITASAPPTITTATKSQDTTLTGWTTSVAAGTWLKFNVDSCTTITQCTLALHVTRAGS